jgi:chromosomal replication initiation ATPase DnaA
MAREAPRQIPLALPHEPRLGADDYLVGSANEAAHAMVTGWPEWPDKLLLLVGDEGAGKTHLAAIWAAQASAVTANDPEEAARRILDGDAAPTLAEDVDAADETGLFHLLNAARERGASLLLTARTGPSLLWPTLPDLASRLRALPVARLEPPDEAMVQAVLVKLLDERQLRIDADIVAFIARRCDRSLGSVRRVVDALDRESLARGRAVGRGLAGDVLARLLDEED